MNFSSLKPETENNANFDAVSSKHGSFDAIQTKFWSKICMNVKVRMLDSL